MCISPVKGVARTAHTCGHQHVAVIDVHGHTEGRKHLLGKGLHIGPMQDTVNHRDEPVVGHAGHQIVVAQSRLQTHGHLSQHAVGNVARQRAKGLALHVDFDAQHSHTLAPSAGGIQVSGQFILQQTIVGQARDRIVAQQPGQPLGLSRKHIQRRHDTEVSHGLACRVHHGVNGLPQQGFACFHTASEVVATPGTDITELGPVDVQCLRIKVTRLHQW